MMMMTMMMIVVRAMIMVRMDDDGKGTLYTIEVFHVHFDNTIFTVL